MSTSSGLVSASPQALSSSAYKLGDSRVSGLKKESLFIGGMSCSTNLSELQQHLRLLSGVDTGLFISMVNRMKRRTFSGYGIIKDIEPEVAQILLQIRNFKFQGCWFGLKPFLKKKSEISKIRTQRAHRKVYLNHITEAIGETDLESYFCKYGNVLHVQISKHLGTDRYKGFGFVEFDTVESAQQVLAVRKHGIKGIIVICQRTNNSEKGADSFTRRNTSSSHMLAECLVRTSKLSSVCKPIKPARKATSTTQKLSDLQNMASRIDGNHILANIVFRVRLSP